MPRIAAGSMDAVVEVFQDTRRDQYEWRVNILGVICDSGMAYLGPLEAKAAAFRWCRAIRCTPMMGNVRE